MFIGMYSLSYTIYFIVSYIYEVVRKRVFVKNFVQIFTIYGKNLLDIHLFSWMYLTHMSITQARDI